MKIDRITTTSVLMLLTLGTSSACYTGRPDEAAAGGGAFTTLTTLTTPTDTSDTATTAAAATAATAAVATTTAAAAEAAATAAAEAATRALFLRTGLVDLQGATAELDAIGLLDGQLGLIGRAHGDERETAGAAGHLVHGDVGVGDGTELLEVRTEFALGGVERQVSNVEFGIAHVINRRSFAICQSVPTVGFEIIT